MGNLLKKKSFLLFSLGILLCIPVVLPYTHTGYFPTHDGEWAVVRAGEMFREIRDHQFPPRYSGVLNYGYGYPLFNFAYPFPYYLSVLLHLFKIGFTESIKLIFAGTVLVSYIGMFLLASRYWKNTFSGFLCAVLYVYLPYRLVDLFVRGSIGESIAFAIYPFLLLTCLGILENKKKKTSIILTSVFFAILITTHNISAVYFGIIFLFLFVYALLIQKNKNALILLAAFFWGTLISCFFWLPAILEKNNILLSIIPIADRSLYYVSFQKLIYSSWGYGTPTDSNPFTYQLGIAQIIALTVFLFSLIKVKLKKQTFFVLLTLVVIFTLMMFPVSFLLWKLPLLSEINYPWTLLLPIGFLMCFLAGGFINHIKFSIAVSFILVVLAVLNMISYAKPEQYSYKADDYYLTNEATTTSSQELMPVWVKKLPSSRFIQKVETHGKVENLQYSSNKIYFTVEMNKPEIIHINQIYYPGWEARVNSQSVRILRDNPTGTMDLNIEKGINTVSLVFKETGLRLFSDIVSIISALGLFIFCFTLIPKKQHAKAKKT